MLTFRFLLVLGLLLHPFCGHCLAELRSMSEQIEATASSVDHLTVSECDALTNKTACTQSPCVKTPKMDLNPLVSDLETRFTSFSADSLSPFEKSVDSFAKQSLPLYLQLSVFRN